MKIKTGSDWVKARVRKTNSIIRLGYVMSDFTGF